MSRRMEHLAGSRLELDCNPSRCWPIPWSPPFLCWTTELSTRGRGRKTEEEKESGEGAGTDAGGAASYGVFQCDT